jgi:hypothetical protein
VLWGCNPKPTTVVSHIVLPQDVCKSCVVAKDSFNLWFANGTAAANGLVLPANSVTFQHRNNCDFYRWSEQMFLWITSPDSAKYGGSGNTVLESPVFYNVSPPDSATQNRTLTAHKPNVMLRMAGHISKFGPNRLPVFLDKKGKMFEIETVLTMVKTATGNTAKVGQVKANAKGVFEFMDDKGKIIAHPMAIIRHKVNPQNIVQRFMAGTTPVFLDANGNQIQPEQGQATGDVLMSQGHSLVYYLTLVNDVYAYYVTGVFNHNKSIDPATFPITAAARDSVCALARKKGAKLIDSNALAIEIKSSWVEASTLPNPQDYVTVTAIIPTYDTTNAKKWTLKGEKAAKMALVGIHIVGSAAAHPEMIWATFEHQSNTPNAKYQYVDSTSAKNIKTVPQDKGTGWLFSNAAGGDTSYNLSHMTNTDALGNTISSIVANTGYNISASNTLRTMPWGSAWGKPTNPEDKSSAASNSEVISINNTIQQLLPGTDVRKNYLFVGAIWTVNGAGPTSISYTGGTPLSGATIGTSVLANSTMETYFQSSLNSCFSCHSTPATPSFNPDSISHIFGNLQPLYTLHDSLNKKKK